MPGKRENIGSAFPQRDQVQPGHIEAIVQILAKSTGRDRFFEMDIRGGNQPHVDGDLLARAHRYDFAFLNHSKQFDLQGQWQIADFIQEQRPAMGGLKPSGLSGHGAGESAPLMAEQLTFHERLADRRTIDRDERAVTSTAPYMDLAGNQLFAGASFADDERRGVAGRDTLDTLQQGFGRRIFEYQATRSDG
jgi:hypothetical protein